MDERVKLGRRGLLARTLATGGALAALGAARAAAQTMPDIVQPERPGPDAFVARALAMRDLAARRGDQAFGAVVVRNNRIVGEAPSRVVTAGDPTAHAEIEAIRDAARRLGTRDLSGCLLYSSFRPCAMCEAAAMWAGIGRMIHGADGSDAGPPRAARC